MKTTHEMRAVRRVAIAASLAVIMTAGAQASSHSDSHSGGHGAMHGAMHGASSGIGSPGKAADANRTVTVTMTDNRFAPERIAVKKGETVRFVLKNDGRFVHEFNIGTAAMHARHQKEMATMVEHGALEADRINHDRMKMDMGGGRTMEHNDPNSVLLEPGKTAELVWKFDTDARLEFACNVPGHYEAGMTGDIAIGE